MSLILCMAGLNTRFHDVGFDIPKYLLPWNDTNIISSILKELSANYKFDQVILLANKRDLYFKKKLVDSISQLGLSESNIYYIGDTNGQAHTAQIGIELTKDTQKPVFIHNADTLVYNRNFQLMETSLKTYDAYVDVFVANSPAFCYIRTNENLVSDIIEKKPISPYASSGLYGFKNTKIYSSIFEKAVDLNSNPELYISDVLRLMLTDGYQITFNNLDHVCETCVLGTPQEYGIALAKKKMNL